MTFDCTFNEFKQCCKEFSDNLTTMNLEELDNAWKCLGLSYLGMSEDMWIDSSAILLQMMSKKYLQKEAELKEIA